MTEMLKRILLWLVSWRTPEDVGKQDIGKPNLIPKSKKPTSPPSDENPSEFYFRKDILDQLDHYFRVMKRMKKYDRNEYDLYSRVGGVVVPEDWVFTGFDKKVESWINENRPSNGCVFMSLRSHKMPKDEYGQETDIPRCFYFTKFKWGKGPNDILQIPYKGADLYEMVVYYDWASRKDWKNKKASAVPMRMAIAVMPDGLVQAIKMRRERRCVIQSKRNTPGSGKKNGQPPQKIQVPGAEWVYYEAWGHLGEKERDPKEVMEEMFCMGINLYAAANLSMARVKVRKGNLAACFGVHIERTPYFFQDRDVTITKNGHRKKIFHIVRGHSRILKSGSTTNVKAHFRGENEFWWNGYNVRITVPGYHHINTALINSAAMYLGEDELDPGGIIGTKKLGEFIESIEREAPL